LYIQFESLRRDGSGSQSLELGMGGILAFPYGPGMPAIAGGSLTPGQPQGDSTAICDIVDRKPKDLFGTSVFMNHVKCDDVEWCTSYKRTELGRLPCQSRPNEITIPKGAGMTEFTNPPSEISRLVFGVDQELHVLQRIRFHKA
jgi:hypothetical protein